MNSKRVFLVNDKKYLNIRYRSKVIDKLCRLGFEVENIGLFESFILFFKNIFFISIFWRSPFISSNLRANCVMMCMPWITGLVIVNGLGRFRKSSAFRMLFLRLILASSARKVFSFQSYADYRWARRHAAKSRIHWIPGSGGAKKSFGEFKGLLTVQRDDKIRLVCSSIHTLLDEIRTNETISVVGCEDREFLDIAFPNRAHCIGFVHSDDIFLSGDIFVQPEGYGEGIPHTLVDAIVSGMRVLLPKRELLKYGLTRIGASSVDLGSGWTELIYGSDLTDRLEKDKISAEYVAVFRLLSDPCSSLP